jgi:hypothetical protein
MKQMIYSELMTALLNIIRAEVFTIIKKYVQYLTPMMGDVVKRNKKVLLI